MIEGLKYSSLDPTRCRQLGWGQLKTLKIARFGFSLIELLVVISIILVLSGIILAIVVAGGTSQDQQNTKALIITVAAAIDQYSNETGSVPLPTGSYSDAQSGSWYPSENTGTWDKQQLWWRLSKDMTVAEIKSMRDAGEAASLLADPYQNGTYFNNTYPSGVRNAKLNEFMALVPNTEVEYYRGTYAGSSPPWTYSGADISGTSMSNRAVYKSYVLAGRAAIAKDLEQRKFKTYACLELNDLINPSFLRDHTLVDAWDMPLVYVGHSTVGVKERCAGNSVSGMRYYGFKAGGRQTMQDRNDDGMVDKSDWQSAPAIGDQKDHNGDAIIDADDWSSILWNAKPGRATSFYLASAGPDTLFNCIYFESENDDNIEMNLE